MSYEQHRRRLLDLEKQLAARIGRQTQRGREQLLDVAADTGDASVADEDASQTFTEAGMDSATLTQVRAALDRVDAGTFGRCVVDGGPIEPARLDAAPWAPYCLKHQQELEQGSPKPSTL